MFGRCWSRVCCEKDSIEVKDMMAANKRISRGVTLSSMNSDLPLRPGPRSRRQGKRFIYVTDLVLLPALYLEQYSTGSFLHQLTTHFYGIAFPSDCFRTGPEHAATKCVAVLPCSYHRTRLAAPHAPRSMSWSLCALRRFLPANTTASVLLTLP